MRFLTVDQDEILRTEAIKIAARKHLSLFSKEEREQVDPWELGHSFCAIVASDSSRKEIDRYRDNLFHFHTTEVPIVLYMKGKKYVVLVFFDTGD